MESIILIESPADLQRWATPEQQEALEALFAQLSAKGYDREPIVKTYGDWIDVRLVGKCGEQAVVIKPDGSLDHEDSQGTHSYVGNSAEACAESVLAG